MLPELMITLGVYYLLTGAVYLAACEGSLLDRSVAVLRKTTLPVQRWGLACGAVLLIVGVAWPLFLVIDLIACARRKGNE